MRRRPQPAGAVDASVQWCSASEEWFAQASPAAAGRAQNNPADFFDWTGSIALPAIGSMDAAFRNVIAFQCDWTSTTDASSSSGAWTLFSGDFGVCDTPKASVGSALAARDRGP